MVRHHGVGRAELGRFAWERKIHPEYVDEAEVANLGIDRGPAPHWVCAPGRETGRLPMVSLSLFSFSSELTKFIFRHEAARGCGSCCSNLVSLGSI